MTYRAPVADIAFTLKHAAGLKAALADVPITAKTVAAVIPDMMALMMVVMIIVLGCA